MSKPSLLEAARALSVAAEQLAVKAANFSISGVYFSEDKDNDGALTAVDGAGMAVDEIITAIDAGCALPPNEPVAYGVLEPDGQVRLSTALPGQLPVALFANPQVETAIEDAQEARTLAAGYRRLLAEAYAHIPSGDLRDRTSAALQGLTWEPAAAEVPAKDPEATRLIERSLRVLRELSVHERLRNALQGWLDK